MNLISEEVLMRDMDVIDDQPHPPGSASIVLALASVGTCLYCSKNTCQHDSTSL